MLFKLKDIESNNVRQFRALWRLPYDVIHGIGLKLGFVFPSILYPIEKRSLIFASLKTEDAYPTMLLIGNGLTTQSRLGLTGGSAPFAGYLSRRGSRSVVICKKGRLVARGWSPVAVCSRIPQ